MGAHGGMGTHKQKQTLVLTHSPAAAQETEQEQQTPHGQEDVGASDEQGVGCHDLPEARGIHQDPDADAQQAGPAQLLVRGGGDVGGGNGREKEQTRRSKVRQHGWDRGPALGRGSLSKASHSPSSGFSWSGIWGVLFPQSPVSGLRPTSAVHGTDWLHRTQHCGASSPLILH